MTRKRRRAVTNQPREDIVPAIQRTTIVDGDGVVIRAAIAERHTRDDPDDKNDRAKTPRQLLGYRRIDPLLTLHRRSPHEITAQHIRVSTQFRDDFEISQGASSSADIGGGSGFALTAGPTDRQMRALESYRHATQAVGKRLLSVLVFVVLGGNDLTSFAERFGVSAHAAKGYLMAALDRLADFYEPAASGRGRPVAAIRD